MSDPFDKKLVGRIMTTSSMVEIQISFVSDPDPTSAYRVLGAIFNPPEAGAEILEMLKPLADALKDFYTQQYLDEVTTPKTGRPGDEKPNFPETLRGGV